MIQSWTPESDNPKPGEASNVQQLRAWFERLPKMRARICQQQEHIAQACGMPPPRPHPAHPAHRAAPAPATR